MIVKALVPTGYGLNCDYETDYSLRTAGAESHRVHINDLISGKRAGSSLDDYQIMVLGGGFSWADDHGAGVILAAKLRYNLGEQIERFISKGKLIIGICNGCQALINLGLLPGFDFNYRERKLAITYNDCGNFVDTWVRLKVDTNSPCVFTRGLDRMELPVRHGEGKFYASREVLDRLFEHNQVVMQYADEKGRNAEGRWPENPNGSLRDIAGVCDPTGRVFALMPHPEAFNHFTNHPDWTRAGGRSPGRGGSPQLEEGQGIAIFRNAVEYVKKAAADGRLSG